MLKPRTRLVLTPVTAKCLLSVVVGDVELLARGARRDLESARGAVTRNCIPICGAGVEQFRSILSVMSCRHVEK